MGDLIHGQSNASKMVLLCVARPPVGSFQRQDVEQCLCLPRQRDEKRLTAGAFGKAAVKG
jgi:hypothetical protein